MKRLGMLIAVGALLFGVALPAMAQQQPSFTVTFGGQLRVIGVAFDNLKDFQDTTKDPAGGNPTNKDSEAYIHERFRLKTTVESADKKARAVWWIEVGDLTWGKGGGASGGEFGGTGARTGNNTGAELGADGVNVETKNAYLQFAIPGIPGAQATLGLQGIGFLASPIGDFFSDDAAAIVLDFKFDPFDLQLYAAKVSENNNQDADDNDFYAARLGINVTKDTRVTVEGLLANTQCFTRRLVTPAAGGAPTATGTCVDADVGDTFWVGGTVTTKVGDISLHGTAVYGRRALYDATDNKNVSEEGWGVMAHAALPAGPARLNVLGWYTTGDKNRLPGAGNSAAVKAGAGQAVTQASNTTALLKDSDKLPNPTGTDSWAGAPYIAEYMSATVNAATLSMGQPLYGDYTGTWGVGGSAQFSLRPDLVLGGGVGFIGATEDNGVFGDNVIEVDAGVSYALNANMTLGILAGYIFPDKGDNVWAVTGRAIFAF